jgi:pimeloyl-ACP methyl ester carboxylesterase
MHIIYFIPGLGADERLFSGLTHPGIDKRCIKWITPLENERLPDYAKRLSAQIDTSEKFSITGASFGGMIAAEMPRFLKPEHLILISSVKTFREIPLYIRVFKIFPIYRIMPESFIKWLANNFVFLFGIFKANEKKLFSDMLDSCPAGYLKGAIDMIMCWKNEEIPEKVIHIQGDQDRIFPVRRIKGPVIIPGGTHFMPYHKAAEVEKIILEKISGI